jgi:hypothetical protein
VNDINYSSFIFCLEGGFPMRVTDSSISVVAEQGIKENELENLILELNNDVDNIGYVLRDIESTIYDIQDYIKGPVGDVLINKFDLYKTQFDLLKSNLLSYPDDLLALKNSMSSNDMYTVNAMEELSQNIIAEANKITNKED